MLDQRQIYAENRDYVLGVLRRRCGWLDDGDREGLFHDAFVVLLDKDEQGTLDVDGMADHQIRAYLAQTALNKALDEGKRAGRRRSVPLGEDDGHADARSVLAQELVDGASDRDRVREIVDELPARQQAIVKLRFFFERSPAEIQEYLGISERAYRRDFERAMRAIAQGFDLLRSGSFCESRKSLILAFVAGIAGPGRVADARKHLATCRACAAWAAELRTAGERVAAVTPMPALLGAGVADDGGGRLASVLETVKHHATSLALRGDAATPTQLAGARPGAAAAAIAGCLAVGGGATYCAVQGLPVPRALSHQVTHRAPEQAKRPVPKKPARSATATTPAAVVRPASTASTKATKKAATPTASQRAASEKAAKHKAAVARVKRAQKRNAELTFEGSGTPAASTPPPASTSSTSSGGSASSSSSSSSGKWSGEFAP